MIRYVVLLAKGLADLFEQDIEELSLLILKK